MKNVKKTWAVLALLGCMQVLHAQTVYLHSDNPQMKWKLKPQAEVGTDVKSLCGNGYNVSAWVDAIVPGTAFNSYVIAGLEKDPNFGDNIHQVNRDKYDRSFWYRTTFRVPADFTKELIWLNFNGVNRRAEVYLNGTLLGKLDGFMHRGHFNVTSIVNRDKENVLAVLVHMPDTPLANQGSPTYLSSGGWDWMPYVPGLNSGITDKVFLTNTGTATLIDPWIRTNLPTRARADLSVALDVKNNSVEKTKVLVRGTITPGNIVFQKELDVNAHTTEQVKFDKRYFPQLCIDQPRLWWPNGYGDPNLYHCKFEVMVDGRVSETKDVSFGIKKYSYDKEGNTFHIYINDIPVFVKGANWGMSEYMLRCRGAEYDTKVRLHKEMNFNMIRNWLGSVTDDEFYEACDKYGIMVWDDFWINSNPNLPYDLNVFNNNMMEKIKRVRNHPSIAVWCGDNESNPQPPLEGWMAENIRTFDGGDRYFQANSHAQGLTGSGPWGAFEPRFYFTKYPDGLEGDPARGWGFRTEIGTAVVPTFESFKKFMPKENWWPRDEMWNKHYFGQNAFNAAPDRYDASITKGFGKPEGIEDYCRKAQLVNIESNKAMYEGWLDRMWEDASGIMTWMGQSAYPSLVWQTYDYYYDLTGAYWGIKKACEPVHIQWSYADNSVKVINTTLQDLQGLKATARVYNLDGKEMGRYTQNVTLNAAANKDSYCFHLNFTTDNLAFGKKAFASSVSKDAGEPGAAIDASDGSRWASEPRDDEWIYVDLGEPAEIATIALNWEAAHAKSYKLLISDDAAHWKEIYSNEDCKGGLEEIKIKPVRTRYVKMQGVKCATMWGYSLYEFELYGKKKKPTDLSPVHFIKLELNDANGNLLSDNFYWRSNKPGDYKALNTLSKAKLNVTSQLVNRTDHGDKKVIKATIKNVGPSVAFAVHVQAVRSSDGERILPALMNDNYFTLLKGESKDIEIEFDSELLPDDNYRLSVIPYNK